MEQHKVEILLLSKQEVDALITWEDVVDGVEDVFRSDGNGKMQVPPKYPLNFGTDNIILPMSGYLEDVGAAGMKWMRFFGSRPEGIPVLWGQMLVMSDPRTGLPCAIMDATTITEMRTSGGHAVVAAKYLARGNSKVLGVLGAGAQGKAGIASFDRHFNLEEIWVFEPFESTRKECKRLFDGKLRARLTFAESPKELVAGADMVLTCSGSKEPVISADWIEKGCFVAGISNFYDLDTALSQRADKWVLGHKSADKLQIVDKFPDKLFMDDVYASLGEVVTGKVPGRETDEEIILFSHMGMGSLDVAVGKRLVEKAKTQGIGRTWNMI